MPASTGSSHSSHGNSGRFGPEGEMNVEVEARAYTCIQIIKNFASKFTDALGMYLRDIPMYVLSLSTNNNPYIIPYICLFLIMYSYSPVCFSRSS